MANILRNKFSELNLNTLALLIAVFAFILYFLPFIVLGDNSFFLIHDNLDSDFVYLKLLTDTGTAFSYQGDVQIDSVMNGLTRSAFRSGLNLTVVLFYLFKPSTAYILNHIIAHTLGFIGMYLFMSRYILKEKNERWMVVLFSLCFAVVPFYSIIGISVSGQPLLLFAFLNLLHKRQGYVTDYLIILFFCFYSLQYLTLAFFFPFLIAILIYDFFVHKKISVKYILGLILLVVCCLVIDFQLLKGFFFANNFESHRTAWQSAKLFDLTISSSITEITSQLLFNQYHSGAFPNFLIWLAGIAAIIYGFWRGKSFDKKYWLVIGLIFLICLWYISYYWFLSLFSDPPTILESFQWNRFYFLLPFLQILFFAFSLKMLHNRNILNKTFIFAVILIQSFAIVIYDYEIRQNVRQLVGMRPNMPNYSEFFSQDLLRQIDAEINQPKDSYRVVSLAMHPSIAQFNGFYTLDSYQNNYQLSYKNQFRKVIAGELAKDEELRRYFDYWGSRCYLFSSKYKSNVGYVGKGKTIEDLDIDTEQLKMMGGKFIISAVEIKNAADMNLEFMKKFENEWWIIYLYYIK